MDTNPFFSIQMLDNILSEYEWPDTYVMEDDLPDGILMRFPKSHFYFTQNYDGDVELDFLASELGTETNLDLFDALAALIPAYRVENHPLAHLELIEDDAFEPSLQKLKNDLDDLYKIIQAYLFPYIMGDLSWLEKHQLYHQHTDRIRKALRNESKIFEHPIYLKLAADDPSWEEDLRKLES